MNSKIGMDVKNIVCIFLTILGAILLVLILRIFFFASFKIPSPSMEPSIYAGDYILVNKLIPGPRLFNNFRFLDGEKIEIRRVKGFRVIRRNDVLVFNFPYSEWDKIWMDLNVNFVKRCIAIPGDTFYIDNGIYKVRNVSDILGCAENQQRLSKMNNDEFRPEIWKCFPYDTIRYNWTIRNFGPLYIPHSNDSILLDTVNVIVYKNLIEYETDQKVSIKKGSVWLGDQPLKGYRFQQNYYFMAGDLVFDSRDSRYWGLLPEDHIIGKATFIWQSKDIHTGKYRWKRFFKTIN